MAATYSMAEARAQLPTIVKVASTGREVTLTRRGQAVAVILSPQEWDRLRGDRADFRTAYRQFLQNHPATGAGVDKDFAKPLRDRSLGRKVLL